MRNGNVWFCLAACFALASLGIAAPAMAQTITAGIDVWNTPDDGSTYVDFTQNPLPAGFFCNGSPAFAQKITVKGSPIATSPSGVLNSTDTIVNRASNIDISSGVGSTSNIEVKAISFVGRQNLSITCYDNLGNASQVPFSVKVRRNAGGTASGSMTIHKGTGLGGTFDSQLTVPGQIVFTNLNTSAQVTATETVTLQVSNAPWAEQPGTGAVNYPYSVSYDTDGDGVAETSSPGTSPGFFAGYSHTCSPPCPVRIDHNGPHPTWPQPPPSRCSKTFAASMEQIQASGMESASSKRIQGGKTLSSGATLERTDSATFSSTRVDAVDSSTTAQALPCYYTTSSGTTVVVGSN